MTVMSMRIHGPSRPEHRHGRCSRNTAVGAQNTGFSHKGLLADLCALRSARRLTQPTVLEPPFHELADHSSPGIPIPRARCTPRRPLLRLPLHWRLACGLLSARGRSPPKVGGQGGHEVAAAFCIHLPGLPVAFATGLLRLHVAGLLHDRGLRAAPASTPPSKHTSLGTGSGNGRRHHPHDALAGVRDYGALLAIPPPVVPP